MSDLSLVKYRAEDQGLVRRDDDAGELMQTALAKLKQARALCAQPRGRLIFGLDLTASREASLQKARTATAAMFEAIEGIGAVALKLVYFRGAGECRASRWHDDPGVLDQQMRSLSCEFGRTQIRRLLSCALAEQDSLSGVVFIGDHIEEDPDELVALAARLGDRAIPAFVFHECSTRDRRALTAKPVFQRLAEVSGGVYCEFNSDSGAVLRELLTHVAAFSAGGRAAVRQIEGPKTPEARQLQQRLLLGAPSLAKGEDEHGRGIRP